MLAHIGFDLIEIVGECREALVALQEVGQVSWQRGALANGGLYRIRELRRMRRPQSNDGHIWRAFKHAGRMNANGGVRIDNLPASWPRG